MIKRSRASRFAVVVSPDYFKTVSVDRGAWYETSEEVRDGLEWGREKAALLRWVRRQMGRRLTERERRCVTLYFFEGLSYREVGRATGTDPASAHRAIQRALRKLRAAAQRRRHGVKREDPAQ